MKIWKTTVLFYLGGAGYMFLEFLWRGRSHGSMFLLAGACFLLMGRLLKTFPRLPLWAKMLLGAALVTGLELCTGLLVNRQYSIWDYRNMPYHFQGQICLSYALLWVPLTLGGMWLYEQADRRLFPG